jgi:uncharacterized protein YbjQ (UPF0145 family)
VATITAVPAPSRTRGSASTTARERCQLADGSGGAGAAVPAAGAGETGHGLSSTPSLCFRTSRNCCVEHGDHRGERRDQPRGDPGAPEVPELDGDRAPLGGEPAEPADQVTPVRADQGPQLGGDGDAPARGERLGHVVGREDAAPAGVPPAGKTVGRSGDARHHHPRDRGPPRTAYLGVVTAQGVLGVNAFKDVGAGMRNIFGGRTRSYENELASGVSDALAEMEQQAAQLGADAVVGVDIDYETVGANMLMVSASRTAVKLS